MRSTVCVLLFVVGIRRFPPKLCAELTRYVRAQISDDVQVDAEQSSFSVWTGYFGSGGDVFAPMLKPSQLGWKLRHRLPIWAITSSVSLAIKDADAAFEESRRIAAKDGISYTGGWRIQVTHPSSVVVSATDGHISAAIHGAAGEAVDFGNLDVTTYI